MTTSTPDLAVVQAEVELIVSRVGAYSIATPEAYEDAALQLRNIKRMTAALDEKRKTATRPMDEAKAVVMGWYRPLLEDLKDSEEQLKGLMLEWQDEQARLLDEERASLEAAASRAYEEGRETDAVVALEERDMVPLKVQRAAGTSTQVRWSARVVDIDQLIVAVASGAMPRNLLQVNQPAVDALARATKEATTQHGVEFFATRSIAASAR